MNLMHENERIKGFRDLLPKTNYVIKPKVDLTSKMGLNFNFAFKKMSAL